MGAQTSLAPPTAVLPFESALGFGLDYGAVRDDGSETYQAQT